MRSDTEDRTAAFEAVCALSSCLSAHLADDEPAVLAAMRDLLVRVHADGEDAARHRLAWLSIALASLTAESMCKQYGPGGGVFAIFNQAREIPFDRLPEWDQVAVTAVVANMNGDVDGASHLIREYAEAATCGQLTEMLTTLIPIYTTAERGQRATGAHRRPGQY